MFKLVVFFALATIVAAKPGYYHGEYEPLVAAPIIEKVITPIALPPATSHTYRKDIISKPVFATYAAPAIVEKIITPVAVAPAHSLLSASAVGYGHGLHGLEGLHGLNGLSGLNGLHGGVYGHQDGIYGHHGGLYDHEAYGHGYGHGW